MFDAPVLLLALAVVVGCLMQPSLVAAQVTFHVPTIIGKVYYVDGFSSLNDSIAVGHGDDGIIYATGNGGSTWAPVCGGSGQEQAAAACPPVHDDLLHLPTSTPESPAARGFGSLTSVSPHGSYKDFSATTATVWSPGPSPTSAPVTWATRPIASHFTGLPHDVTCHEHFGGCPMRMPSGCGRVHLADGSMVQSAIVYWGGNGPYATSVVAYRSTDGGSNWQFASIIANASAFPASQEGPNENDLAVLSDGKTIIAVIRMDAGDGPETHPYKNYYQSTSSDGGMTWTTAAPMPGSMGCARPRLLRVGGSLVLSGGRAHNHNTSDVLMWVNADGMGKEWQEYSISYWHNRLEPNSSLHFTPAVNSSSQDVRESTAYTSLLPTSDSSALITYGRHLGGSIPDVAFSMEFTL